jgi:hypothetical protein
MPTARNLPRWAAACAAVIGCLCVATNSGAQTAASSPSDKPGGAQPAGAPVPAAETAPAAAESQPAESAESSWPPGLLMEGLDALGPGKPMEDYSFRLYGFAESGFTGRLTGGQHPLPLRGLDARRPNNVDLHQLWLTAERGYDSNKAFDVGGRVTGVYGSDAKLIKSEGLFPYTGEGEASNWFDLFEAYGQFWFKTGDESGLEMTVGKWGSPMGYETTDAVHAPFFSRSYLFNYAAPYTHTGVKANYIINPEYSAYFAIVEGADVFQDNNDAHTYMAGGTWNSADKVDDKSVNSFALNVMTGPEQDNNVHHFRTTVDGTFTHWWTGKLSQTVNADFATEEEAPLSDGDVGRARWYGVAHYLGYTFNEYVTGTWRAEWFRDDGGSRSGFDGDVFENTWGVNLTPFPADKVLKNLSVRPEFRWDFACDPAFGDNHRNQLTAALDVIYKF